MENNINFQRIETEVNSTFDLAKRYYSILMNANGLSITNNELDLVSYLSVNGSMPTVTLRKQFCSKFNVPIGSIYNMISKLKKLMVIVSTEPGKKAITINPSISPNFNGKEIVLILKLINNDKGN